LRSNWFTIQLRRQKECGVPLRLCLELLWQCLWKCGNTTNHYSTLNYDSSSKRTELKLFQCKHLLTASLDIWNFLGHNQVSATSPKSISSSNYLRLNTGNKLFSVINCSTASFTH
jgi:hypothetical protein